MQDQFIKTLLFVSNLNYSVQDYFWSEKFSKKILDLSSAYIDFEKNQEGNNDSVAQYYKIRTIMGILDDIEDLIVYLRHVKGSVETVPFSEALKNILELKLVLIREHKNMKIRDKEQPKPMTAQPDQIIKPISNQDKKTSNKADHKIGSNLNENQERIFQFVKKYPEIRTKEIIQEFSSLSERTVKRNLVELVRAGALKRRAAARAAYYSAG